MATGVSEVPDRIWKQVLSDPRSALEQTLAPTDLQTLLLGVARRRASSISPARVAQRWREDAFVQPSTIDPRRLSGLEAELWRLLPETFVGLELSPVAPMGTCAATADVDQNRVLTTTRNTEVVSDPTNVLAVEAARRRRADSKQPVDLASCHRVLRTQRFPAPYSQHFRLFALVSSAPDTGSARTEAGLFIKHLEFYIHALATLAPTSDIHVQLSTLDSAVIDERVRDTVLPAVDPLPSNVTVTLDRNRQRGRGYYAGAALRIDLVDGDTAVELGDGGLTDWTSRLTGNAKERCLVSCISTERLAAVVN